MASSQRVKSVHSPKPRRERKQTKVYRGQSVSLASYTIRVRAKRDTQFKRLGAFNGRDSFFAFVRDFISELEGRHAHDELSMSLQRARNVSSDVDSVWGVLEAGDYGYAAELVSVATMESSYRRAIDDAELLPFYFLLNAPADTDKALLIIQRYGNHGVFTEFTNALRVAFEGSFGDYILDIRRHVPGTVIEALKQGKLKAIQLTSYALSKDLADKVRWRGNRADVSEVVITIKAKRKGALPRPAWIDKLMQPGASLYEVPASVSEIGQRVRVAVTYNGKQRFVDFESTDRIAPYVDVTGEVKFGDDGHPQFDSIHQVCVNLLFDLMVEIGRPA